MVLKLRDMTSIPLMATTPNLTCVICCGILTDASYITNCGHEFCHQCILKWFSFSEQPTCPICRVTASTNNGLTPCPLVRKVVTRLKSKHPNDDNIDPDDKMVVIMEVIDEEVKRELYYHHLKSVPVTNKI
jgi:hypothetical protein